MESVRKAYTAVAAKVGIEEEEPEPLTATDEMRASLRDAHNSMSESLDEICPALTYTQRIIGFVVCAGIGWIMAFGSFFRVASCITGNDCILFGLSYTFGNLISLSATFFLMGPCNQLSRMCDPERRTCVIILFTFMVGTLVVSMVSGIPGGLRGVLIVFCIVVQFFAFIWYALSYIPFARNCVVTTVKSWCGGICS